MKRQRQSEITQDICLKSIERGLDEAIPQCFEDARRWFIEHAPVSALQSLAKKFGVSPLIPAEQLRNHWGMRNFHFLYERCDFLLCVQRVYKNMQRLHFHENNIQKPIPHLFANMPITLEVQYLVGAPQTASIVYSKYMAHNFDAITILWDDVHTQLPDIIPLGLPLYFDGITQHATNVLRLCRIEKQDISDSLLDTHFKFDTLRSKLISEKRYEYGLLLSICPFNDFVLFHVRNECLSCLQTSSNLTIKGLQDVVLSYIGTVSLEERW